MLTSFTLPCRNYEGWCSHLWTPISETDDKKARCWHSCVTFTTSQPCRRIAILLTRWIQLCFYFGTITVYSPFPHNLLEELPNRIRYQVCFIHFIPRCDHVGCLYLGSPRSRAEPPVAGVQYLIFFHLKDNFHVAREVPTSNTFWVSHTGLSSPWLITGAQHLLGWGICTTDTLSDHTEMKDGVLVAF